MLALVIHTTISARPAHRTEPHPPAHPHYAPFLLKNPPFDAGLFISNGLTGEDALNRESCP